MKEIIANSSARQQGEYDLSKYTKLTETLKSKKRSYQQSTAYQDGLNTVVQEAPVKRVKYQAEGKDEVKRDWVPPTGQLGDGYT